MKRICELKYLSKHSVYVILVLVLVGLTPKLQAQGEATPVYQLFVGESEGTDNRDTLSNVIQENDATYNKALSFIEDDSYIRIDSLSLGNSFTFSVAFNSYALLDKNRTLIDVGQKLWIRTTTQRELQVTMPGRIDHNTKGLCLTENCWYQMTVSVNRFYVDIYLDGKKVETFNLPQEVVCNNQLITIGKNTLWRENFKGKISGVSIWDRFLNDYQVEYYYNANWRRTPVSEGISLFLPFGSQKKVKKGSGDVIQKDIVMVEDQERGVVAELNGKTSYIDCGEVLIDNAVSISLWVKPKKPNQDNGALVGSEQAWAFRISGNSNLTMTIPQVKDIRTREKLIEKDVWQHVAVTYLEGKGVKFYKNGLLVHSDTISKFQEGAKLIRIGNNLWNNHYLGLIDDVVIWKRVLSADDINEIYETDAVDLRKQIKVERAFPWGLLIGGTLVIFIVIAVFIVRKKKIEQERLKNAKQQLSEKLSEDTTPQEEEVDPFLQSVHDIVEKHISDSAFTVEEFARELGTSRTGLYKQMKELTGLSANVFIRDKRLEKAKELLLNSEMSVSEVIYATGFESRAYFNKCFREKYGYTPSGFRQKIKDGFIADLDESSE
ncbi:helix-turn-helix domain-containing protein [Puteibacter caeruleilacunae]|nr:helix-turn-helix domain-containing protein [Puteibacter caeruleilacunae]